MCQNHTSPFGALADAYFAHDSMAVWHGSRGLSGKSMTLALLAHMESIFLDVDIAILGGSGQQSKNVHRYQDKFWQYETAPTDLLAAQPTATMTRFKSGQEVLVLLASQTSVRSPHPVRLRLDEVDEMDLSIFEAAMGQTMATPNSQVPAQTVASSTHQYPDGTFTEVLERATNRNWPVYSWCIAEGELVTTQRGQVPIETVTVNDFVLTRKGMRPVQHVTAMGYKPCVILRSTSGATLTCTPDHQIASTARSGWSTAIAAHTMVSIRANVPVITAALAARISNRLEQPRPSLVFAGTGGQRAYRRE